jgi:hypothetical protein
VRDSGFSGAFSSRVWCEKCGSGGLGAQMGFPDVTDGLKREAVQTVWKVADDLRARVRKQLQRSGLQPIVKFAAGLGGLC